MLKAVIKKILNLIPTLLGVSVLAFLLIRLVPGDPVMLLLGERGADPQMYAEMKRNMGLDRPMIEQYFTFLGNICKGDFGHSIVSKRPVLTEFFDRFPATLELGMMAMSFAITLGIPFGIIAAIKRNSFFDFTLMGAGLVGYSMPIFWWGLMLIIVFSVKLGWTPVSGRIDVLYEIDKVTGLLLIDSWMSDDGGFAAFKSALSHLILPALAMGTIPLAVVARMTRSSMLEVLGEDYIRTARAKGLPFARVIIVHALRNALVPIVTILGLLFGSIITGAILTEMIFSWPGIGKWIVFSINARDYPVIQGGVVMIASLVILTNTIVDIVYLWANPRMRA
ncbi:MAG: ABC transporter permease subunit [Bdellovibrionota bacterium]